MRGKPWSIEEERHLRQLVDEGKSVPNISQIMGKTLVSVRSKLFHLGLYLKDAAANGQIVVASASSPAASPVISAGPSVVNKTCLQSRVCVQEVSADLDKTVGPLPSIEEKLRVLDAALRALEKPGLSRTEISRLRTIILGVKEYQKAFAEFVNYQAHEAQIVELRKHLASEREKK